MGLEIDCVHLRAETYTGRNFDVRQSKDENTLTLAICRYPHSRGTRWNSVRGCTAQVRLLTSYESYHQHQTLAMA